MSTEIMSCVPQYGDPSDLYHYNMTNNNIMSYNSGYHPPPIYTNGLMDDKHSSIGGIISSGISTDCSYWSEEQSPVDPRFMTRSMSISSDGFDEDEEPHEQYCGNEDYSSKYYYQDNGNVYPTPKQIVEPNSYVNLEPTGKPLRNITKADIPIIRVVKRRNTANKKERRRTQSINNAFSDLRECIPNVPSDTKLSKIKTLRLATSYISYLMKILETDDIISIDDFKADLSNHSSHRKNSKNHHQYESHMQSQSSQLVEAPSCSQYSNQTSNQSMLSLSNYNGDESLAELKKTKGRTGWPQHVWALELKQEQL